MMMSQPIRMQSFYKLKLILFMSIHMFVFIKGQTSDSCTHGEIRLFGENGGMRSDREGRAEVCFEGVWGEMCGLRWDNREAQVVCRQLNLNPDGASGSVGNLYGTAEGPFFFNNVLCVGSETRLLDCDATRLDDPSNCPTHLTAQVKCQEGGDVTVSSTVSESTTQATATSTTSPASSSTTSTTQPIIDTTSFIVRDSTSVSPAVTTSRTTTSSTPTQSAINTTTRDSTSTSPGLIRTPTTSSAVIMSSRTTDIPGSSTSTEGHITDPVPQTFAPEAMSNTTLLIIVFGSVCGFVIVMLFVILFMLFFIIGKRRGFKIYARPRKQLKLNNLGTIDNMYKTNQQRAACAEDTHSVNNPLYRESNKNGKKSVATVENYSYESTDFKNGQPTNQGNHEYSELSDTIRRHVYTEIELPGHVYAEPRQKPQPYSVPITDISDQRSAIKPETDSQGYSLLTDPAQPYEIPNLKQDEKQTQLQGTDKDTIPQPRGNGDVESSLDQLNRERNTNSLQRTTSERVYV